MVERTINCSECGVSYTYDEKAGYPRKYCANCSQQKKQSFNSKDTPQPQVETVKVVQPNKTTEFVPKEMDDKRRTSKDVTLGEDTKMAVNMFVAMNETNKSDITYEVLMDKAISLVKQAKEGLQ